MTRVFSEACKSCGKQSETQPCQKCQLRSRYNRGIPSNVRMSDAPLDWIADIDSLDDDISHLTKPAFLGCCECGRIIGTSARPIGSGMEVKCLECSS